MKLSFLPLLILTACGPFASTIKTEDATVRGNKDNTLIIQTRTGALTFSGDGLSPELRALKKGDKIQLINRPKWGKEGSPDDNDYEPTAVILKNGKHIPLL